MAKRGRPSKWQEELDDILSDFLDEEEDVIIDVFDQVAEDTKDKVKQAAKSKFKGEGKYAAGWEVKKGGNLKRGKYSITVCNPEHYRLTHLLEKGHQSWNQYGGSYKRVRGRRHIKPAEKWGNEELIARLKKEL